MAITIPETISRNAMPGERLFFNTLKKYLPDEYIVYFEPDIYGRKPDFVIIGPSLGVVIIEVKDYTKNTLIQLNKDSWLIYSAKNEQVSVPSPLNQAREYTFTVKNALCKNSVLTQQEGNFRGQAIFPYGYGVFFSRFHETDLIDHDLFEVIPPHQIFSRSEIDPEHEAFSAENLLEKLHNMFPTSFRVRNPLSKTEIDTIRFILFPEVRISAKKSQSYTPYNQKTLVHLTDLKAMDLYQERLARQIGDGHRLIRGVAGSGKTLVLASHAKLLAKDHPEWNILVLCFNISLAQFIRNMIETSDIEVTKQLGLFELIDHDEATKSRGKISVMHFHHWLHKVLNINEESIPDFIESFDPTDASLPQYDAILIDEGQDFEPEWFQLVSQFIDANNRAFLLVEDRAQSIYKRKRSYKDDFGLSFQGRSRVLTINYRNTEVITDFAWDFYKKFSALGDPKTVRTLNPDDIIIPETTKRSGKLPALIRRDSFTDEIELLIKQILKLNQTDGVDFKEMLILYRVKSAKVDGKWINYIDYLREQLAEANIPFYWMTETQKAKLNVNYAENSVKISTIESSKGLDFKAVFIIGAHNLPFTMEDDPHREASLFYIGMTRARDLLWISYSGDSIYTDYFDALIEKHKQ